jgi:hypothetical protein
MTDKRMGKRLTHHWMIFQNSYSHARLHHGVAFHRENIHNK